MTRLFELIPDLPMFDIRETGIINHAKDGIVTLAGLRNCSYGQKLVFRSGATGMIIGFDERAVQGVVFDDTDKVSVGDTVAAVPQQTTIPVGDALPGRVIDVLGVPLDGRGAYTVDAYNPVFRPAPGIMDRIPLEDSMPTGTKIVDLAIPVGKGQRELIIGDRQSGKSTIALDAIINQKGRNTICIYCWIGGAASALKKHIQILGDANALDYTVIVAATADEAAAKQYLAPYSAAAVGEYFMDKGRDVLVIFDDLTKHAWIYRQISLLLERAPGREAYPGDIFYVHSQLLERAARMKPEKGGGSMTFLPIVETLQGDISGYIQTNIVSITDGQIYVSAALFKEGFRPAIDLGLSVSRIGSKVQTNAMKAVSKGLRLEYAQYRQMLKLTKLRTRMSPEAEARLKRGAILTKLLSQSVNRPVSLEEQVVLFYIFSKKYLELVDDAMIDEFAAEFFAFFVEQEPMIVDLLKRDRELSSIVINSLEVCFKFFLRGKRARLGVQRRR